MFKQSDMSPGVNFYTYYLCRWRKNGTALHVYHVILYTDSV